MERLEEEMVQMKLNKSQEAETEESINGGEADEWKAWEDEKQKGRMQERWKEEEQKLF